MAAAHSTSVTRTLDAKGRLQLPVDADAATQLPAERDGAQELPAACSVRLVRRAVAPGAAVVRAPQRCPRR